jgi:hypothetical protein
MAIDNFDGNPDSEAEPEAEAEAMPVDESLSLYSFLRKCCK